MLARSMQQLQKRENTPDQGYLGIDCWHGDCKLELIRARGESRNDYRVAFQMVVYFRRW